MEELIKKSDAIKAVNRAKAEGMTECPTYYLGAIPSVQVPPKPKDDVIGYRWVLKWDLKELWTGLR